MKLLLDEDVPEPLIELLQHLLRGHQVEHVATQSWKSKKDLALYPDAARRGFHAVLTNDLGQFSDPDECTAIRKSGLHHITYTLDEGLDGLALASASICAAIRPIVAELENAPSQRIVRIVAIAKSRKRYECSNPSTEPPSAYW